MEMCLGTVYKFEQRCRIPNFVQLVVRKSRHLLVPPMVLVDGSSVEAGSRGSMLSLEKIQFLHCKMHQMQHKYYLKS